MASVNKVILVGNLGKDPDAKALPNGDAVCTCSIATTESWKDKASGEKKEQPEWHRVVFFGKVAEVAGQYLKKGSSVYVEGKLTTRKWTDKEGVEKYTTEIRADTLKMLGGKPAEQQERQESKPRDNGGGFKDMSDDVPFNSYGRGIKGYCL